MPAAQHRLGIGQWAALNDAAEQGIWPPACRDQTISRRHDPVEHDLSQERPAGRLSEREHALQTALAFGFLLAVSGASMAVGFLLH